MQICDQVSNPSMSARMSCTGRKPQSMISLSRGWTAGRSTSNQMHDAQVNATHIRLVVVDQADTTRGVGRVDRNLFLQFAAHAFLVGIAAAIGPDIDGRNVPADADAPLAMQPLFALAAAASVLKHRIAALGAVPEDHVRDQLLEARVVLHLRPQAERDVRRAEQLAQVAVHLRREALKVAQAMKKLGGHDENVFDGIGKVVSCSPRES